MRICFVALSLVVGLVSPPALADSLHEGRSARNELAVAAAPQQMHRTGAPRRLSDIAPIPEPSAMTLFGVGVLLVLQAIPLRSLRSSPDSESGGVQTR